MIIWCLTDERIGSSKQAIILANKLCNNRTVIKNIIYNKFIILPNLLKFKTTGIDFKKSDNLTVKNIEQLPEIIIFAGRRLAGLALYLKKEFYRQFKKNVKLISILNPNYNFKLFDFVILPKHDGIKTDKYKNVIAINGSICELDENKIKTDVENFKQQIIKQYKHPCYCLMVGGDTKNKKMNISSFKIFVKNLDNKIKKENGFLLISTSRRTNQECITMLKNTIRCEHYLYQWQKDDKNNPYFAFLGLADKFITTADSISMLAEIINLHKMTYVYVDEKSIATKHKKFIKSLATENIIATVNYSETEFKEYSIKQYENELERICEIINSNVIDA